MSASADDKSGVVVAGNAGRGPRLRVVCVNDVYSLENLPRLKSLVEAERGREPADRMLVTLAGDFVAPSMLSSLDKGRGMIDALNCIGVTHVCFGNHEDDIPLDELRGRTRELSGVWLNSNIHGFEPPLPAFDLVEVTAPGGRSVRVGLLGVVMHNGSEYRRPPFGGGAIDPANETVLRIARYLLSQAGCTVVLPLTHQDIELDRELLAGLPGELAARIPLLIGGHEHRVYLEQVAGIQLIKAGNDAEHAAVVDLEWPAQAPDAGLPDAPTVRLRLLDTKDYPEDAGLRARVSARMQAVRELEAATLLLLPPGEVLSSVGTRYQQTSMSTLLSSRIRDAESAEGCLLNGGGVRGNREYRGRFTYGDLKAEVPFDNEVVVVQIPGRVLAEAIRSTRSRSPGGSGAYLHVDDRMTVREPEHELVQVAGEPLDLDRLYRIALVRNLLTGMDRIEPLIEYAQAHPERLPGEGSGREVKVVLVDSFSKDLFAQLGHFEQLDTDRDGTLSKTELAAALSQLTSAPASPITVDLLLRAIDQNADGVITRGEADALRAGRTRS
ncbi:MAG TPA: 5'-nucleotidase C-terminal domain-containing protein [Pseudomonadota bacterium]|nr:5'-nucleotidase C-terminal domain-containing protein [Pseudomonadota bacterium]